MRISSVFLLLSLPFLAFAQTKPAAQPTSKSKSSSTAPTAPSKTPAPAATTAKGQPTTPTAKLLTAKDSIFLSVEKGQKIIQHPVKAKQTLFSVAKFYGLSLEELYEFNPKFQTDPVLRIGERVRIPIPNVAIKRYKRNGFVNAQNASIYYIVQPMDNLFQISKRYFDMPVDSVMQRNRLKNNSISPGQRIQMGWLGIEGIPLEWRKGAKPITHDVLQERYEQQHAKYKEVSTQGICIWNQDSREKGDLYALHREAAIGTIIFITNPGNKRTTFAKVIGRIPPNYENSVEVVLSPAAARRLGATKPQFMSRVKFLK